MNLNVSAKLTILVCLLEVRVKQHVPHELLRRSQEITSGSSQAQESAIDDYWSKYYIYGTNNADDCFCLSQGQVQERFGHLEANAIKLFRPTWCRQKNISYSLLIWGV